MNTEEVIRKTLALAQTQLSNYRTMGSQRAVSVSSSTQDPLSKSTIKTTVQTGNSTKVR